MKYRGECGCGAVRIDVELTKPLSEYTPRACDCDFCVERNAQYLSDPEGLLRIVADEYLDSLTQGSEQAAFLQCAACHQLIAATIQSGPEVRGALNAMLLTHTSELRPAETASPKRLSPEEKLSRWETLWMPVEIAIEPRPTETIGAT